METTEFLIRERITERDFPKYALEKLGFNCFKWTDDNMKEIKNIFNKEGACSEKHYSIRNKSNIIINSEKLDELNIQGKPDFFLWRFEEKEYGETNLLLLDYYFCEFKSLNDVLRKEQIEWLVLNSEDVNCALAIVVSNNFIQTELLENEHKNQEILKELQWKYKNIILKEYVASNPPFGDKIPKELSEKWEKIDKMSADELKEILHINLKDLI